MEKILRIGIDISMNNTGITFFQCWNNQTNFYLLSNGARKVPPWVKNIVYTRNGKMGDLNQTFNAINLSLKFRKFLKDELKKIDYQILEFIIEAPSYGRKAGMIVDIAYYNFAIKSQIFYLGLHNSPNNIQVVPPKTLKKDFTGSGNSGKDKMILKFKEIFPDLISGKEKIDDIVDSYALTQYKYEKNS